MSSFKISSANGGTPQNIGTTLGAATGTILGINAAAGATTLRRTWLMEWEIGASGVPNSTDCPIIWDISEMTAAGTATLLTPKPNDQGGGDAAALAVYNANYTAAPTVTASSQAWGMPLNQRASYRVQMRDEFHALISAAINLKGWALRAASPNYASTVNWTGLVKE